MSQLTCGTSHEKKRTLVIDGHDFTKKRHKLLSTGDAQDTVHTNAACSQSQQEMNSYQQKMVTATMLDLGKLRQTRFLDNECCALLTML